MSEPAQEVRTDDCTVCGIELGLGLTQSRRAVGLKNVCIECAQFAHSTPDDEFEGEA